jgi:hypothetical protein
MLDSFFFFVVSQWYCYEELHFMRLQEQNFGLSVCVWLENASLFGGTGVEDQTNGLRQVSVLLHLFCFVRVRVREEVYPYNQEHLINWNAK